MAESENFKLIRNFYEKEGRFLELLQIRWEDEYMYEDKSDYQKAIKSKAERYGLKVKSVSLGYRDMSIKITFEFENATGHIDILKTKNKVYLRSIQ